MQYNPHILVIDDSLDIQCLLRTIFEAKGYSVDCSPNGAEALSLLQSQGVLPDVILVDLRMPVMDGYDFLSSQRKIHRLRDIPTVIMTGDGDDESARLRTKSPNDGRSPDILIKPLSVASILNIVERKLNLH